MQISGIIGQVQQQPLSDKNMTMEEKTVLKQHIGQLTSDQQRGIIDIVRDCINQSSNEIFEFELDQLPSRKCRELEQYVKKCIQTNVKKEKRKMADRARRDAQKNNKIGGGGGGGTQPVMYHQMPQQHQLKQQHSMQPQY